MVVKEKDEENTLREENRISSDSEDDVVQIDNINQKMKREAHKVRGFCNKF